MEDGNKKEEIIQKAGFGSKMDFCKGIVNGDDFSLLRGIAND